MNLIFRVDASAEIGNGHFYRCLNLAETFEKKHKIFFISCNLNNLLEKKLKERKINLINIKKTKNQLLDASITLKKIKTKKIYDSIIILDSYKLRYNWQKKLYNHTKLMFVIDDLNRKNYADIILNQNLSSKIVINKKIKNQKFLLGPKYCLLNKNYLKNKIPQTSKNIKEILIFLGGSDSKNITSKILKIISNIKFEKLNFKVIIGQNNKKYQYIIKNFSKYKNIDIFFNIDSLTNLIKNSDFIVSSLGTVLWEIIYFKKPFLGFLQNKNQAINLDYLSQNRHIKICKKVSETKIALHLLKNKVQLTPKNYGLNIDGKGVFRVKEIIKRAYEK